MTVLQLADRRCKTALVAVLAETVPLRRSTASLEGYIYYFAAYRPEQADALRRISRERYIVVEAVDAAEVMAIL